MRSIVTLLSFLCLGVLPAFSSDRMNKALIEGSNQQAKQARILSTAVEMPVVPMMKPKNFNLYANDSLADLFRKWRRDLYAGDMDSQLEKVNAALFKYPGLAKHFNLLFGTENCDADIFCTSESTKAFQAVLTTARDSDEMAVLCEILLARHSGKFEWCMPVIQKKLDIKVHSGLWTRLQDCNKKENEILETRFAAWKKASTPDAKEKIKQELLDRYPLLEFKHSRLLFDTDDFFALSIPSALLYNELEASTTTLYEFVFILRVMLLRHTGNFPPTFLKRVEEIAAKRNITKDITKPMIDRKLVYAQL